MMIEVLSSYTLQGVVSASGIVKSTHGYFVIGDDSPYLFALDNEMKICDKIGIHKLPGRAVTQIQKSLKPDFEAMEIISEEEIIVFGSGSKSPERDIFKRLPIDNPENARSYQISGFYDVLRNLDILKNHYLNIEATAYKNGKLYLFNRGKNIIFSFEYYQLISYLEGMISMPKPEAIFYKLPFDNKLESGFSGATALKNAPYLLFTASVEDTTNPYDDGEIFNSFIGMIHIGENGLSAVYQFAPFPIINNHLKVESVTIIEELEMGKTDIMVVTDDDKGRSMALKCRIFWDDVRD